MNLPEWEGYQLDAALAFKHDIENKEFILDIVQQLLEGMAMIARSNGAKVELSARKPLIEQEEKPKEKYIPTLQEAIQKLGGRGTVLVK